MKTITVSELRKRLKDCLDTAAAGEEINIERSGVVFTLKRKGFVISSTLKDMATKDIQLQPDGDIVLRAEIIEAEYCPNGHRIPDGRSKCLSKGCKYA